MLFSFDTQKKHNCVSFKVCSLGRVALYTVLIVLSLPKTVVKTLAQNLVKHLDKHMVNILAKSLMAFKIMFTAILKPS